MRAIDEAIERAKGVRRLAVAIGVRYQAVQNWSNRGAPPLERCPAIERFTGVRCDQLRPDVRWLRGDRDQPIGYQVMFADAA